jgi:hypothetical protein
LTAEILPVLAAPQSALESPPAGTGSGEFGPENIVATGIGEEYQGGSPTGRMAIKVYVRRKLDDADRIAPDAFIDKVYRFNGQDYPADVEERLRSSRSTSVRDSQGQGGGLIEISDRAHRRSGVWWP